MSKKSRVWNFFYKESDTVAICCLCHKNYSRKGRGTTCLRNHLKSKHPAEFLTLSENDIKYMVKTEINDNASVHTNLQLHDADPLEVQRVSDSDETYASDEKLALMIAQHDYSFSFINSVGFVNFIKVLQPRYVINTVSYYENMLCQDIYRRMQTQLKQQLVMLDSVSLATSISWRTGGQGLLSLSCHGISNDFQYKQFHLKCEALDGRHTEDVACRIRIIISNVCQELQLPKEKINCIIRDEGTCTPGSIVECNVHLLKLCVKYALESNEHLKQLDAKCLQIAKHFEQSPIAYNHLKYIHEKQLNREPLQLMEHNHNHSHLDWNAIFRLKSRMLKLKDALSLYAEEYNMVKIYPDEWLDIDLGQRVIQPIEEIVNILSGTSATASSVIPLIAALRDSLRTDVHNFVSSVTICSFARKLLEELESRCSTITTDIKYLMATYLDPRYKQAFFTHQEAQLVTEELLAQLCRTHIQQWQPPMKIAKVASNVKNESKIDSFLDNMLTLSNTSTEASTSLHSQSQSQLKNLLYLYNSEPRVERQSDPITWWRSNNKYSALFPIVRRYLSTPAASIASERIFDISKSLYSDMQVGLCPENVSKILFIKANLKALEQV
ncbi:PREDICTED: zinc finger BED domain-containing protein 4 [Drosophila arizonae]|uniref:Zinc finger BED domain-containing protein 4 n=1 Tax=Drosophila arizonae TaxID=7263 RepID=A0ABM1NXH1_DROAR|nr:PREDICTED: zinc finger BED domain-containing protein 4 [Drosophila arizonae]